MTVQPRYLTNGELVWLVVLESRPRARIYYTADGRNPPKMLYMGGWSHTTSPPQNPLSEGVSAEFRSFPFTAQSVFCCCRTFQSFLVRLLSSSWSLAFSPHSLAQTLGRLQYFGPTLQITKLFWFTSYIATTLCEEYISIFFHVACRMWFYMIK